MTTPLDRRTFLRGSAVAAGSALTCTAMVRTAAGDVVPRIEAPLVDKLVIRVVVDGAHDIFIPEQKVPDIAVAQARMQGGEKFRRTLQSEWGLSLHLTSQKAAESRRYLLDFAYTPDVLNNNLELLEIDLPAVDGMILSHGHLDHWGGLPGFLEKHRAAMRHLPVDRGHPVFEQDLDAALYEMPGDGFPRDWQNPFRRTNRDSGAILVGAGAPPPDTHGRDHGPDRSRLDFSNYGSALDVQAWGREVTTCGYGDLQGGNEDQWYTDQFSGTSSASPVVVGALGCMQGARRAQESALLTPMTARGLLRSSGSPQQDAPGRPSAQRIGNRPDLRQLLTAPVTS